MLLITATLSTGPFPVPSSTTSFLCVGGLSAEKYTHPTVRDSTAGSPSNLLAAGPSVATTIARAVMVDPDSMTTVLSRSSLTRELSTIDSGDKWDAICRGSSSMPRDGTTLCPWLSERKITSNIRREVARWGSSCIPPKSGRKKRSIIRDEKPKVRSATSVETSCPPRSEAELRRNTRARSATMRTLSSNVPIGANAVDPRVSGLRNGSETT